MTFRDETMREGMQIENADIPTADKIRLLEAISEIGVPSINAGSFVSPRYTPQMRDIDNIITGFKPKEGVRYYYLALNQQGRERAKSYMPPLSAGGPARPGLGCHMCDIFIRRNANRSQADEMAEWPRIVEAAKESGVKEANIGVNATWGSNFQGSFTTKESLDIMERQHDMWDKAGIKVTGVSGGDPMSHCRPHAVEEWCATVLEKWPDLKHWGLHLHNARGMAIPSLYAALRVLDDRHTLDVDSCLGGIGGCPYCGNGRATGMMATEDMVFMLEEMGIPTPYDLEKTIRAVWMLEEVLGRVTDGHVSKCGPTPRDGSFVPPYDMNLPFVETFEHAKHFLLGSAAYEGAISPWREPIVSDALDTRRAKIASGEIQLPVYA